MNKPLGLGVSGCGAIAIQAVFMHAVEEDGQELVKLAAVCDPVPGRAKEMAEKYNVPHYYTSYEEMLADPTVDLVTLCSPIGLHYEQGMKAIAAGKHVHFNKTMALSAKESTDLIDAAAEKGVKLVASPGQMLSPANRKIRKAILTGELGMPTWTIGGSEGVLYYHVDEPIRETGEGKPKIIPAWYYKKPAGGPQWDCTVYSLHTMTGIFGPAKRVIAFSGQMVPSFNFGDQVIESEVDDSTMIVLDFGKAFYGVMYSSLKGGFNGFTPIIFATKGKVMDGKLNDEPLINRESLITTLRDAMGLPHLNDHQATLPQPHVFEDILQLADWVLNGKPSVVTAEHARHVIEIFEAGYLSAETGKVVELTTTFDPIPLDEL